ncbi:hypothetical protein VDGE_30004 [Verticillium dahliae]|uniref:Uncharacterized protein n=1 Tax=Verticillium dahliae TaxID=27337 RepID=A0A444S2J4_VERDA|nr:hypothetical protein VDGE_30004 [Verticillium dahliae]
MAASEDNGTRAQDASERTPNVIASLESLRDPGRNIGAAVPLALLAVGDFCDLPISTRSLCHESASINP